MDDVVDLSVKRESPLTTPQPAHHGRSSHHGSSGKRERVRDRGGDRDRSEREALRNHHSDTNNIPASSMMQDPNTIPGFSHHLANFGLGNLAAQLGPAGLSGLAGSLGCLAGLDSLPASLSPFFNPAALLQQQSLAASLTGNSNSNTSIPQVQVPHDLSRLVNLLRERDVKDSESTGSSSANTTPPAQVSSTNNSANNSTRSSPMTANANSSISPFSIPQLPPLPSSLLLQHSTSGSLRGASSSNNSNAALLSQLPLSLGLPPHLAAAAAAAGLSTGIPSQMQQNQMPSGSAANTNSSSSGRSTLKPRKQLSSASAPYSTSSSHPHHSLKRKKENVYQPPASVQHQIHGSGVNSNYQPRRSLRPRQERSYAESPDIVVEFDEEPPAKINGLANGTADDDEDASDSDCTDLPMPPLPVIKELTPEEVQDREILLSSLKEHLRNEEMKLVLLKKLRQSQTKENQHIQSQMNSSTIPSGGSSKVNNSSGSHGQGLPLPAHGLNQSRTDPASYLSQLQNLQNVNPQALSLIMGTTGGSVTTGSGNLGNGPHKSNRSSSPKLSHLGGSMHPQNTPNSHLALAGLRLTSHGIGLAQPNQQNSSGRGLQGSGGKNASISSSTKVSSILKGQPQPRGSHMPSPSSLMVPPSRGSASSNANSLQHNLLLAQQSLLRNSSNRHSSSNAAMAAAATNLMLGFANNPPGAVPPPTVSPVSLDRIPKEAHSGSSNNNNSRELQQQILLNSTLALAGGSINSNANMLLDQGLAKAGNLLSSISAHSAGINSAGNSSSSSNMTSSAGNASNNAGNMSNLSTLGVPIPASLDQAERRHRLGLSEEEQIQQQQTPAQRQAAAKLALRKQLEKTLLQIPPPKPPPPEMNFIPNPSNMEFLALIGLEFVVDYITKDANTNVVALPANALQCSQCNTDFSSMWKWDKGKVICEICATTNAKKSLKAEHTNRLKTAFVQALQQEQEIEQRLAQGGSLDIGPAVNNDSGSRSGNNNSSGITIIPVGSGSAGNNNTGRAASTPSPSQSTPLSCVVDRDRINDRDRERLMNSDRNSPKVSSGAGRNRTPTQSPSSSTTLVNLGMNLPLALPVRDRDRNDREREREHHRERDRLERDREHRAEQREREREVRDREREAQREIREAMAAMSAAAAVAQAHQAQGSSNANSRETRGHSSSTNNGTLNLSSQHAHNFTQQLRAEMAQLAQLHEQQFQQQQQQERQQQRHSKGSSKNVNSNNVGHNLSLRSTTSNNNHDKGDRRDKERNSGGSGGGDSFLSRLQRERERDAFAAASHEASSLLSLSLGQSMANQLVNQNLQNLNMGLGNSSNSHQQSGSSSAHGSGQAQTSSSKGGNSRTRRSAANADPFKGLTKQQKMEAEAAAKFASAMGMAGVGLGNNAGNQSGGINQTVAAAAALQAAQMLRMPQNQQLQSHLPIFSPLLYPYQMAMAQAAGGKQVTPASLAELQRQAESLQQLQRQYLLDMIPNSRNMPQNWKS